MKKIFTFSFLLILFAGFLSFVPEQVSGTVYYVDAARPDDSGDGLSWATAFKTVNQGTYIADYTDQIWVKAGFYLPTSEPGYYLDERETSFVIYNKQAIYGGFAGWESSTSQRNLAANITILSGDIGTLGNPSDNSYNVFWTGWGACPDGITLDGLTIQDGNANVLNNFEAGGAIFLADNRITLRNCTFKNNYAEYQGGAIYGDNGCQMTIDNCKFSNNISGKGGGAISVYSGSSFTVQGNITNCEFYLNQTFQGGAAVNVGWNNSGGNMYFTFINTVFHDNNSNDNSGSGSGGAVQVSRSLAGTNVTKFINCLFYGNRADGSGDDGGGAIMIYRGDVQVYYSTIANNISATKGGAISLFRPGCYLTLLNSIVSGNTSGSGNSVSNDGGGSAIAGYTLFDDKVGCGSTCLPGLTCGTGVLFGRNPMFVSSSNFQLQSCSPAIDQGYNLVPDEQLTDLAGNNRRYSPYGFSPSTIDMGAYEFSSNVTVCSTCSPSTGSLSKTPNQSNVCIGSNVSASLTAIGSYGDGIDQLEYRTKTISGWSSWSCYTTGDNISTTGKTEVEIRTYRNSSFCPASTTAVANWVVDPASNGGNISGSTPVCYGTNSTLLTLYGQTGTVLNWQYTTNDGANWYDFANTNTIYTATNLITTTNYRAKVQSGVCTAVTGGYAALTVRPVFTEGSIKKSGETICYNFDPAQIGDSIPASGGDASIAYQWQSSLNADFTGTPSDIATNAASYNPPANLTATTWYRRQAKDGTCNTSWNTSAQVWKVTVKPLPIISGNSSVTQGDVVTYSTPYRSGNHYTWNASHGNPEICFPNRNCLTLTWDFPCGVINPGYVTVTETDPVFGCIDTVTKWITINP